MQFEEVLPRPELRPYVNCFWAIHSHSAAPVRDRTFPDGCQEIVFNIHAPVLRSNGSGYSANPRMELIGQMTRPYDIVTRGHNTYFGIKFYPHSFSVFTRESVHDLRDQSLAVEELLRLNFARAADTVFERPRFDHFVATMEAFFLRCLVAGQRDLDPAYPVVDRAVRILLQEKDRAHIDRLPQRVGVSERSLQLMFRRHVGLSPKQLFKMIRFQSTFQYLHEGGSALTDIAHRCGYYDQAHFAHDFKALAGVAPSIYRRMDTPLNRFFLAHTSHAYLCNYKD